MSLLQPFPPALATHAFAHKDGTDFRWELPALLQPVNFVHGRWVPVWPGLAAEQCHDQLQVAVPGPVGAVHPRLYTTVFQRFVWWQRGVFDFYNRPYVWDSRKGGQLTRSLHLMISILSANFPLK